ncbi:MAG: Uma2 family endonuclease [Chloroflexi bacterium]|nr:Uma2 family endonuclease [Chloroflexota bacterium]
MTATIPGPVSLESGDRLTRAEFHRRYCARPDIKKAELVEGVVYVPSPARFYRHSLPHTLTHWWLNGYAERTPDVQVGLDATIYLDADNEVQPDAFLFRMPAAGGQIRMTDNDYLEGAPELVVEIAASSASYDLHDKMHAYRRNGVLEYIVWRTLDAAIDWFRLVEGVYVRTEPDEQGMIESTVFPGLRLDVPAMLAGDRTRILAALR